MKISWVAVLMILTQVSWVLAAWRHRRQEVLSPSPAPLVHPSFWAGLCLTLPRFLAWLRLPRVTPGPSSPPWLRPWEVGEPPASAARAWADLVDATPAWIGPPYKAGAAAIVLLALTLPPPVTMALAAYGTLLLDPAALPDALSSLGAYVVTAGALLSARTHSRLSVVATLIYPFGALLLAGAWGASALRVMRARRL